MNEKVVVSGVGFVLNDVQSLADIAEKYDNPSVNFNFFTTKSGETFPTLPIAGFDLASIVGRCKNKRYLPRAGQFGLAAAKLAINDANLSEDALTGAGLFSGLGPNLEESYEDAETKALWLLNFLPNTLNSVITSQFKIHGGANTYGNACAASTQAIAEAFEKVKFGLLPLAIAGGADSRINEYGISSYASAQALYKLESRPNLPDSNSPDTADYAVDYRPMTATPRGFVPGEGSAYLVIETETCAIARGASIYAEILGCGYSSDGYNMTAPDPDGFYAGKAIEMALSRAGLTPSQIDCVSCHGTGTSRNDEMEQKLLESIFGSRQPEIFTFKKIFGHLASACGAAETVATIAMLNSQSTSPRATALIQNFGFGGQNTALIIRKYERRNG